MAKLLDNAELIELGRRVAEESRDFEIDGRPLTNVEMFAAIQYQHSLERGPK